MNWFSAELFEELRKKRGVTWGRPVRWCLSATSTNDLALNAVTTDAKTGIVWLAREQTAGRGRRGNAWLSPPGEGLTFSLLLRLAEPGKSTHGLSLAVGVALRDMVAALLPERQTELRVKWPNDLMAGPDKLAGILIEGHADGRGGWGVVVGVGINVLSTRFAPAAAGATSLCLFGAEEPGLGLESLLVDTLGCLERRCSQFFTRGLVSFHSELNQCDYLRNRLLDVDGKVGHARGIDEQGRLILEQEDGQSLHLPSGHVRLL